MNIFDIILTNGHIMTDNNTMSTSERKERERLQRYNSILDAAEEVFSEKGFSEATVEDIAKKAQLSKGAIYLYFKSKELIHIGINIRANKLLKLRFIEAAQKARCGLEGIANIGKEYYKFAKEYPNYFKTMSFVDHFDTQTFEKLKDEPLSMEAHDTGQAILNVIADVIRDGIEDGSIREDVHPMRAAVQLWAQSNGVITLSHNWHCHYKTYDLDLVDPYDDFGDFARRSLQSDKMRSKE